MSALIFVSTTPLRKPQVSPTV